MKNSLRTIIFPLLGFLFIACGQSVTAIPSATPALTTTTTATPTLSPIPTQTATTTTETAPKAEYVPPTLLPTIDPALVHELLNKAFSIQTIESVNGHSIRQITGWEYGFGGGYWTGFCQRYHWLDIQHLLMYPATGQTGPIEGVGPVNVVPQPVVLNLETGFIWLPPAEQSASPLTCNRVYWSQELGVLITTKYAVPNGSNQELRAVSTYTFDGEEIAHYWGGLRDVSPSGTKILITDDTLVDLRNNKIIDFDWYINYDRERSSRIYWSADESRVYRCCYYFGDTDTGTSYNFEISKFEGTGARPSTDATHGYGQWVRNGEYFLIEWSVVDDGYPDFFPMFDPTARKYYEVSDAAGVPSDWTCVEANVSPDGTYMWLECWEGSYLINLENFQSVAYPDYSYVEIEWSNDGQFAWVRDFTNDLWQILSVSGKELQPVSIRPLSGAPLWWHPKESIVVYPSADKDVLILLDASTMSYRELPFTFRKYPYNDVVWSPNGEKLALVEEDGRVWQVDYPTLANLEPLTPSLPDVSALGWSPDGNFLSFISGSDIYIVEVSK